MDCAMPVLQFVPLSRGTWGSKSAVWNGRIYASEAGAIQKGERVNFRPITTGNNGLEVVGTGDGPATPEIVALACELLNALHAEAPGLVAVWQERKRMIAAGFTAEHDDAYEPGMLTDAATAHLCAASGAHPTAKAVWPFPVEFRSSGGRGADLVKAAAFIIAEIERGARMEKTPA